MERGCIRISVTLGLLGKGRAREITGKGHSCCTSGGLQSRKTKTALEQRKKEPPKFWRCRREDQGLPQRKEEDINQRRKKKKKKKKREGLLPRPRRTLCATK